jgi:uncharacterized protein (DUF736 family)
MTYDNTNTGVLFVQKKKKTPKHPDFTGNLDVEGKPYRIAGWKRMSRNNSEYISIALSEPYEAEDPTENPEPKDEATNKATDDTDGEPW